MSLVVDPRRRMCSLGIHDSAIRPSLLERVESESCVEIFDKRRHCSPQSIDMWRKLAKVFFFSF